MLPLKHVEGMASGFLLLVGMLAGGCDTITLNSGVPSQAEKSLSAPRSAMVAPTNLVYRATRPSWGDTFLPKSKTPAKRLLVVKGAGLNVEERVALACLQGLTSRTRPCLWLRYNGLTDFWLDWHVARGYVEGYDTVTDWRALFKQFSNAYKGAVVPDRELYRGDLLAANVAACEDLIIASPELAAELGIPIRIDLRKRFVTYADGMEWVWQTYSNKFNHHLCNYLHPARLGNGAFAYDIQWRSVMLWPAGKTDGSLPGADPAREKRLTEHILSELAPNSAILGFPYAGEHVGMGEVYGVKLASQYAKPLVCNDSLANLSVMSGVQISRLKQTAQPLLPVLDTSKIYVALVLSDGDNQNCWLAFMKKYFDHKRFGEFPLAFGMGPAIIDLMPGVAQWYYEKGGSSTEFIADVSGIGYIQPQNYGTAFTDREAVFDGFLDWTGRYMKRLDMGSVRTVEGEDEMLKQVARKMPDMHSLFADMGRYSGHEGITNLTYRLPDGMPVFRAVTSWRFGTNSFPREIREQVGKVRPAFVNGFLHCWTYKDFELICKLYDERPADMVFVTPRQLATLYKQASPPPAMREQTKE